MTRAPVRYLVPSDVVTHMAISLMHALEALRLAATICIQYPIDTDRLVPALQHLNAQLGHISGALDAIVHEQNGEADGSSRLC